MKLLLKKLVDQSREWSEYGNVASYIPELAKINPDDLGISLYDIKKNEIYCAGDSGIKFTIQSISKIITLMLALNENGEDEVFSKVGKEPTGDPFNSIIKLETYSKKKPFNPMINAGAIAITSLIKGKDNSEKFAKILNFFKKISGNNKLVVDNKVFKSEKETGDRNRSIAFFLKSLGVISGDVNDVLDLYFKQCSIMVSSKDIARVGAVLSNGGVAPWNGEEIISRHISKIINSFMVTCGLYDGSGRFAIQVGIPAKSGVGGGILCSVPGKYGIGVYGPALNRRGNSIAGIEVLKKLSQELDLSIF